MVTFGVFNEKFGAYALLALSRDDVISGPRVQTGDVDADWDDNVAVHGGTARVRKDSVAGDVVQRRGTRYDVTVTGLLT